MGSKAYELLHSFILPVVPSPKTYYKSTSWHTSSFSKNSCIIRGGEKVVPGNEHPRVVTGVEKQTTQLTAVISSIRSVEYATRSVV